MTGIAAEIRTNLTFPISPLPQFPRDAILGNQLVALRAVRVTFPSSIGTRRIA